MRKWGTTGPKRGRDTLDKLKGRRLTRRGHSDSAWQSYHGGQTWLTMPSCWISSPNKPENEREIRRKASIIWISELAVFPRTMMDNGGTSRLCAMRGWGWASFRNRIAAAELGERIRGLLQTFRVNQVLLFCSLRVIAFVKFRSDFRVFCPSPDSRCAC